jgi:hypothetical protein
MAQLKLRSLASLSFSFLLASVPAWAKGGMEDPLVSVAGGIASPSSASAVFQNAAGLAGIPKPAVNAHAFFPQDAFKDGEYGLGLLYGKGGFGLAAGVEYQPTTPSRTAAYYGLAASAQSLHLSLGAAGRTPISPSGDSAFNLGVLVDLGSVARLGVTAIGVSGNPDEYGFGLGFAISNDFDFVTDATVDDSFDHLVLAPGVRVGSAQAALTVSYAFKVDSKTGFSSRQIREGFSVGGGLRLGSSVHWEVYYNQLAKYATSLSIEF